MSQNPNPVKRKTPDYGPESVNSLGETNVELDSFTFLWTVRNYSVASGLEKLKSPLFYGGPKSKHAWQMRINPKKDVDELEYLSIFLYIIEYGEKCGGGALKCDGVQANFAFSILNSDGQPAVKRGSNKVLEFVKGSTSTSWGFSKFIQSADLVNPTKNLVVDDTLKIHCEVKIIRDLKQELSNGGKACTSPSCEERSKRFKDGFVNGFGKLFKEEIGSDVTILVAKTGLKAHKAVLTAQSSVFAAMFSSNMIEKESSTVEISDFDEAVVKGMLEHLYTGQTECISQRAAELLQIAEKYNLPGLKEDCEYELGDNLTHENAAVVFVLAHTHNAPRLKERTTDYIKLNKDELWATPAFRDVVKAQPDQTLFSDLFHL